MKRFILVISCINIFLLSCDRTETLAMKGAGSYKITDEYIPLMDDSEPPHLLENGWVLCSGIYQAAWSDYAIIATRFPADSSYHEYYVIYSQDSMLTGKSDIMLGPLTGKQLDSVIRRHNIDESDMKVIDFNN